MELRGRRRCTECGRSWSYFETGSPACPSCGSLQSVSADDAALHTDGPAELDLAEARTALSEPSLATAAERSRSAARDYLRSRGFVRGGELVALDDDYLAAAELSHVAEHVRRSVDVSDETEAHLLSLLSGELPGEVPPTLRWARGLAAAEAVAAYRHDLHRWLEGEPPAPVRPLFDRLRAHERRLAALDGDAPPAEAEALVAAARAIGDYLRDGDGAALERSTTALDDLE